MLSPVEMEQIRELIRYDAVLHSGTSTSLSLTLAALAAVGGWFLSRWRQRKAKLSCPICASPVAFEANPPVFDDMPVPPPVVQVVDSKPDAEVVS